MQLIEPENQFIVLFLQFLIVLDELDFVVVLDQFPLLHVRCQLVGFLPFPLDNSFKVLNILRLQFLLIEVLAMLGILLIRLDEVFEQNVVFEHFFAFALEFKDFVSKLILLCGVHIS